MEFGRLKRLIVCVGVGFPTPRYNRVAFRIQNRDSSRREHWLCGEDL